MPFWTAIPSGVFGSLLGVGKGIGVVCYPRVVPKDVDAAAKLKKRTLTNLYNERPAWLANAHKRLDGTVFAAYGWPADLSDDAPIALLRSPDRV